MYIFKFPLTTQYGNLKPIQSYNTVTQYHCTMHIDSRWLLCHIDITCSHSSCIQPYGTKYHGSAFHCGNSTVYHLMNCSVPARATYLEQYVLLLRHHVHVVLKVVTAEMDGLHKDFFITLHLTHTHTHTIHDQLHL